MIAEKSVLSINPFASRRDVLLVVVAMAVIATIIWLFALLFDSNDWDLEGGIAGACAAVVIIVARLIPVRGRSKKSTRNNVIDRLGSLHYAFESRDDEGNLHFRRVGNTLTRWDSERATIFVGSESFDQVVAPLAIMLNLR